jgi:hypothetical protein
MLSRSSKARLRTRAVRLEIATAALLSVFAVVFMWGSAHHRLPSAKLQHHAAATTHP